MGNTPPAVSTMSDEEISAELKKLGREKGIDNMVTMGSASKDDSFLGAIDSINRSHSNFRSIGRPERIAELQAEQQRRVKEEQRRVQKKIEELEAKLAGEAEANAAAARDISPGSTQTTGAGALRL